MTFVNVEVTGISLKTGPQKHPSKYKYRIQASLLDAAILREPAIATILVNKGADFAGYSTGHQCPFNVGRPWFEPALFSPRLEVFCSKTPPYGTEKSAADGDPANDK